MYYIILIKSMHYIHAHTSLMNVFYKSIRLLIPFFSDNIQKQNSVHIDILMNLLFSCCNKAHFLPSSTLKFITVTETYRQTLNGQYLSYIFNNIMPKKVTTPDKVFKSSNNNCIIDLEPPIKIPESLHIKKENLVSSPEIICLSDQKFDLTSSNTKLNSRQTDERDFSKRENNNSFSKFNDDVTFLQEGQLHTNIKRKETKLWNTSSCMSRNKGHCSIPKNLSYNLNVFNVIGNKNQVKKSSLPIKRSKKSLRRQRRRKLQAESNSSHNETEQYCPAKCSTFHIETNESINRKKSLPRNFDKYSTRLKEKIQGKFRYFINRRTLKNRKTKTRNVDEVDSRKLKLVMENEELSPNFIKFISGEPTNIIVKNEDVKDCSLEIKSKSTDQVTENISFSDLKKEIINVDVENNSQPNTAENTNSEFSQALAAKVKLISSSRCIEAKSGIKESSLTVPSELVGIPSITLHQDADNAPNGSHTFSSIVAGASSNILKTAEIINNLTNSDLPQTNHSETVVGKSNHDIETVDFLQHEYINWKNIEYSLPIQPMAKHHRSVYDKKRQWVPINDETLFTNKENYCTFTILDYNVLAQTLLNGNLYLYTNCNPEYLSWKYRWNLLQHEVRKLSPCILTLQEIDTEHYKSHFLPWLSYYGYKGIFKKRTGNKYDGCAIFFKSDMFNVLEQKSVEYYQKSTQILNRDNIGLIVKLTPKEFYQPFCVSTTHLLYNPKRSDIRMLQMVVLLAELDRFCYLEEKGGAINYCPLILTGDFNANPNSALLSFLCKSKLRYDDLDATSLENAYGRPVVGNQIIPPSLGISNYCHHSVLDHGRSIDKIRGSLFSHSDKRKLEESLISLGKRTQSNANLSNCSGSLGTLFHRFHLMPVYEFNTKNVTTFHERWAMVDYIFYSKKENGNEGLKILSKYALPSIEFANYIGPLPCAYCPSDHFPLAAKFVLPSNNN